MSTALSALLPERVRSTRPERHLRPLDLPGKRRRPKLVYALTAVIGAVVIGVAQLGLSIATTQTTYEIRQLTEDKRALKLEGQALYDQVAGLSSPQYLASNAASLGMVVGGSPTYLRLSDGAVIGAGTADATSTIDARRAAVANELVSDTPLIASPGMTMTGEAGVTASEPRSTTIDALPTPQQSQVIIENSDVTDSTSVTDGTATADGGVVTDGLPTPQTH